MRHKHRHNISLRLADDHVRYLDKMARRDGHGNRSIAIRKLLTAAMNGGDDGNDEQPPVYDGRSAAARRMSARKLAAEQVRPATTQSEPATPQPARKTGGVSWK